MAAPKPNTEIELRSRLICRDREAVLRAAPSIDCNTAHAHKVGGLVVYMACDSMPQFAYRYARTNPGKTGLVTLGVLFGLKALWGRL